MKDQDLKQSEPSYYSVTPAPVRYSHINNGAKLLYGEITALSNKHGYCWATNSYFANLYGTDKSTIKRWIRQLSEKHFIKSVVIKDENGRVIQRRLWITNTPGCKNAPTPRVKNEPRGGVKNEPENITRKNTTSIINNLSLSPLKNRSLTKSKRTTKQVQRETKNKSNPLNLLTTEEAEAAKLAKNSFNQWGKKLSENEMKQLCLAVKGRSVRTIGQLTNKSIELATVDPFQYFLKLMKNEPKEQAE